MHLCRREPQAHGTCCTSFHPHDGNHHIHFSDVTNSRQVLSCLLSGQPESDDVNKIKDAIMKLKQWLIFVNHMGGGGGREISGTSADLCTIGLPSIHILGPRVCHRLIHFRMTVVPIAAHKIRY